MAQLGTGRCTGQVVGHAASGPRQVPRKHYQRSGIQVWRAVATLGVRPSRGAQLANLCCPTFPT
jgi:hypothetical protein